MKARFSWIAPSASSRPQVKTALILVMCLLVAAFSGGCDILKSSVDKAIDVIDKATSGILARSDVWQATLEKLAQDLPSDIAELVRTEAQNLATRTVAQAGTELMCSSDFYARRAVEALTASRRCYATRAKGRRSCPRPSA